MSSTAEKWPDFLIVGTARAGTTSLHEYLGGHPDIFMPLQKEPCFFTFYDQDPHFKDARNRYTTTISSYLDLFKDNTKKIAGESSTPYLYFHTTSISNIKKLVPGYKKLKIIILLRDPAERAYSQYMQNRRDLREPLTFEEAIAAEAERKKENWHFDYFYSDKGFYYAQVKEYLENFDEVKIYFYDDLEKDPQSLVSDLCTFLGVDPSLSTVKLAQRNQSGEMKVKWFKRIITTRKNPILNFFRKFLSRETKKKLRNKTKSVLLKYNLKKEDMNPQTRKQLIELYGNDIVQLSELIHKDLNKWLQI